MFIYTFFEIIKNTQFSTDFFFKKGTNEAECWIHKTRFSATVRSQVLATEVHCFRICAAL